jgi:hypothetical protein
MGGIGSTRWGSCATKRMTDNCLAMDVRKLKRTDKLLPGVHSISWDNDSAMTVMINADVTNALFQFDMNGQSYSPSAHIVHTECHYGGERPWFVCEDCEKRYAVLYLSKGSMACRGCHDLLYTSQVESEADRAIRKAQNLGIRLGFGPNLVNGELMHRHKGPPSNMTQHTYSRLLAQYTNARIRAILMV